MTTVDTKTKKIASTIVRNCVDSTESIPKIVDYFAANNAAVFRHYTKVIGRRPENKENTLHYATPGHPLNTFKDDWDGVLPSRYFKPFMYKSSLPKVISTMHYKGASDPVTDFMKKKIKWKNKLSVTTVGIEIGKYMSKFEKLNDEVVCCPKNMVEAAVDLESDPLPHFDSCYNWYYAGQGNMHIISLNMEDYLLHSEFHTLYLTKISLDHLMVDSDHTAVFNCKDDENILETVYSDNELIFLRTRFKIIILKMIINDHNLMINIEMIKEIENSSSYTSISCDTYHKNILYVTSLDNNLTIVNLDLMKGRSVKLEETESLVDNWSTVIGNDRNSYCHIGRKTVKIYDKRNNNIVQTFGEPGNVSDEYCNQFSVVKKCDESPLIYAGTNHHLFLLDTRNLKKKFLQRWTHHMKCVPTFISLCKFEMTNTLVCLNSQWYEDMCIVPNDDEYFKLENGHNGIYMPFRPTTIEQTLNAARMKMLCLDIYNQIETRLYMSITGNAIIERNDNYIAFTQNSLGDIVCHTLYPDHNEVRDDDGLEQLHEWCKDIKEESKTYEVSNVIDISKMWRQLRKIPDDHEFHDDDKLIPHEELKYSEQEIVDAFESDKLDSGLLNVWINEGDEGDNVIADNSLIVNLHFSDSE